MHFTSGLWLTSFLAARVAAAPARSSAGSEDASHGLAARAFEEQTPETHLEVALESRGLHITNDDGSVNLDALTGSIAKNAVKYGKHSKKSVEARGTTPLRIKAASAWSGLVKIGNPAQEFQMYFDTGSTDMTVADATCSTVNCGDRTRYSFDNSSSAVDTGLTRTSSFADGTTSSGYVYQDKVRSGNVQVPEQTFLSATSLSSTVAGLDSDGIMGLGYTALSATGTTSFPFTLYAKGLADSIQLRLSNTAGLSKIIFGKGVWSSNYKGSIAWYKVTASAGEKALSYWQVAKSSANVNGKRVISGSGVPFIVDSGTTYIVAPPSGAKKFWSKVSGAKVYDANHWSFPCSSPPSVSLSFGLTTKKLSIKSGNFNLGYTPGDKTRCIGAVVSQDLGLGSAWVIGDSFLKSWYSVFDMANDRIGFATPNPL